MVCGLAHAILNSQIVMAVLYERIYLSEKHRTLNFSNLTFSRSGKFQFLSLVTPVKQVYCTVHSLKSLCETTIGFTSQRWMEMSKNVLQCLSQMKLNAYLERRDPQIVLNDSEQFRELSRWKKRIFWFLNYFSMWLT